MGVAVGELSTEILQLEIQKSFCVWENNKKYVNSIASGVIGEETRQKARMRERA